MQNETARHNQRQFAQAHVAPQVGERQHDAQPDMSPAMADLASAIQQRQLTTSCLLLLASHRPLTFFTGQLLYALAPLAALVGLEHVSGWAALLSAPDANARLTELLATPQHPVTQAVISSDQL